MDTNTIHYMEVKSQIEKCEKYRTQGYIGILIGIFSLPAAIFLHWLCGFGIILGVAGIILVFQNSIKLNVLKKEMNNILAIG